MNLMSLTKEQETGEINTHDSPAAQDALQNGEVVILPSKEDTDGWYENSNYRIYIYIRT